MEHIFFEVQLCSEILIFKENFNFWYTDHPEKPTLILQSALFCTILHSFALFCTILHYFALFYTMLHYFTLFYTKENITFALFYTILHYFTEKYKHQVTHLAP